MTILMAVKIIKIKVIKSEVNPITLKRIAGIAVRNEAAAKALPVGKLTFKLIKAIKKITKIITVQNRSLVAPLSHRANSVMLVTLVGSENVICLSSKLPIKS